MKCRQFIKKYNDKILHFCVGFSIIEVTYAYTGFYSLAIVTALGLLKETIDYFDYGKFDLLDLLFTVLGGIVSVIIMWYLYN